MPLRFATYWSTVVACTAVLAVIPEASATTRRVPSEHTTIQAAIDAATPGDEVLVAAGTYFENLDLRGKFLILRSESGSAATIVDGGHNGRVLNIHGGGVVTVDGFTLQGGRHLSRGAGVCSDESTLVGIRNNVIRDNVVYGKSGYGGGVFVGGDSGLVENNLIKNNECYGGGGGLADGSRSTVVQDNTFIGNTAFNGGAGAVVGGLFTRNLVAGNFGEGIASLGTTTYNTVVGNYGVGIYQVEGRVEHNIIANNGEIGLISFCRFVPLSSHCNDSWGHTRSDFVFNPDCEKSGTENFSSDPQFCGPQNGDYHLSASSPCAAANNAQCGGVGAFEAACGSTASSHQSWGSVKIRYR